MALCFNTISFVVVVQLVTTLHRSGLRSPVGMCILIRYTAKLLQEDLSATDARAAYQFLESCLRQKNDVSYPAAFT